MEKTFHLIFDLQLHQDTDKVQKSKLCIWLMFNMIMKASLMGSNGWKGSSQGEQTNTYLEYVLACNELHLGQFSLKFLCYCTLSYIFLIDICKHAFSCSR